MLKRREAGLKKHKRHFLEQCSGKGTLKEIQKRNQQAGTTGFLDNVWDFFIAFAKHHDQYQIKMQGVVDAKVMKDKKYKVNDGVYVIRADGTEDDFSLNQCITNIAGNKKKFDSLNNKMRTAIFCQRGVLKDTCNECNAAVQPRSKAMGDKTIKVGEADHVLPFNLLQASFLEEFPFEDTPEWMDRWSQFHLRNASWQTLCVECHRVKSRREQPKRQKK